MTATIRPATPADGPALVALLQSRDLEARLRPSAVFDGLVLVAEADGQVVGMLQVLLGHPVCVLTYIAVAEAVQGQGVAAALMSHMECVLRVLGYPEWFGMTSRPDVRALAERGGAEILGEKTALLRRLT